MFKAVSDEQELGAWLPLVDGLPLDDLVDRVERGSLDVREIRLRDVVAAVGTEGASVTRPRDRAQALRLGARLVLLKSQDLLGDEQDDREEERREPVDALRLAAIRATAAALGSRDVKGQDVFGNGRPKPTGPRASRADLGDALRSLDQLQTLVTEPLEEGEMHIFDTSIGEDEARAIVLDRLPAAGWVAVDRLAENPDAAAAIVVACLDAELEGTVELQQEGPWGQLLARRSTDG